MIANAETHRQASHVQCAHCYAPQEETAARLSAKAWLACLLEQEVRPCSTGITACGSSQTKQQVQSCRSDCSLCCLHVHQASTAVLVTACHVFNDSLSDLQLASGHDSHAASIPLRNCMPHAAASGHMLTEEVQTCVSLVCRLQVIAAIVSVPSHCLFH